MKTHFTRLLQLCHRFRIPKAVVASVLLGVAILIFYFISVNPDPATVNSISVQQSHSMLQTTNRSLLDIYNGLIIASTESPYVIDPINITSSDMSLSISKFRVRNFTAFNLTHNGDMKHIYTISNQYPFREVRDFQCIPTSTVPSFTICVYSIQEDVYISGSLRQSGTWDLDQTILVQGALNRFPDAMFVDVGANIGYFSLLARAMGRAVIAIEPTHANFLRLQEGVVRNKFSDNILLLKYAISDERTTVIMGKDDHNQGGIAVAKEIRGFTNNSLSVEAITLNDLARIILSREIIIKMDIEGYECKAIHSSMEFLQKFKVRYIFMEWLIMPQNQDKKDTPCPKAKILHMLANIFSLGMKPFSFHGLELDITNSGSWRTNDVYWKPDDSPNLI
ncbi:hypothetical protein CHS0354_028522 [Potamilus streckersoni]|uniref:Methyltransferase FkbM domain-containing protein n=1 Tax=Potamilus streckersoni TaxID=2493646 RepID=A0AAE0RN25_9BIVA|nr:hypothetical protein CHS0354_028522 [Potamilus streckersoni]